MENEYINANYDEMNEDNETREVGEEYGVKTDTHNTKLTIGLIAAGIGGGYLVYKGVKKAVKGVKNKLSDKEEKPAEEKPKKKFKLFGRKKSESEDVVDEPNFEEVNVEFDELEGDD